MSHAFGARAGWTLAVLGLTSLTACGGAPGERGFGLGDMVLTAGTTLPPAQSRQVEDVYCPPVDIVEGGSAIQVYAGGQVGQASALRSQISIAQLARECVGQPDGSTLVKVGIEGRALLGAGGSAGRYDVPVSFIVKRGSTVLANRARRTSVAIPAGSAQASFAVVEEGIVVPAADANSFEIEVGLVNRASAGRRG